MEQFFPVIDYSTSTTEHHSRSTKFDRTIVLSQTDVEAQFRDFILAHGVDPHEREQIVADGLHHPLDLAGHPRGNAKAHYTLHADGVPNGWLGCQKLFGDELITWKSDVPAVPLSAKEKRARTMERRRRLEAEARAKRVKQDEAAVKARKRWEGAWQANDVHPYLLSKGLKSHGLRMGPWWAFDDATSKVIKVTDCALYIPMYSADGELRNLQAIWEIAPTDEGKQRFQKKFMPDGEVIGCSFRIGKPREVEGRMILFVGEGYASSVAVRESSHHAIAVAFECTNLVNVAKQLRNAHPSAAIFIAADNDSHLPINLGMKHAREAAAAVDGYVIPPPSLEQKA